MFKKFINLLLSVLITVTILPISYKVLSADDEAINDQQIVEENIVEKQDSAEEILDEQEDVLVDETKEEAILENQENIVEELTPNTIEKNKLNAKTNSDEVQALLGETTYDYTMYVDDTIQNNSFITAKNNGKNTLSISKGLSYKYNNGTIKAEININNGNIMSKSKITLSIQALKTGEEEISFTYKEGSTETQITKTVHVIEPAPTPTFEDNLTYNGRDRQLLSFDEDLGYEFYQATKDYSNNKSTFDNYFKNEQIKYSSDLSTITKTDAGTYYIYWRTTKATDKYPITEASYDRLVTVSISKATLTADNIVFDPENAEYNFTNSTIRPSYKVVIDGNEISNSDCEVTDSNGSSWGGTASTTEATNVGDYTIYFTGKGNNVNSNGSSPIAKTWHIVNNSKDLSLATISLTKDSFEYTESEIDVTDNNGFKVTVPGVDGSLTLGDDFEIVSGNTGTDVDTYTLTITGKGEWTGTATKTWSITKKSPQKPIGKNNLSYNGLNQELINAPELESNKYKYYVSTQKINITSTLNNQNFTTNIPNGINYGTYYIYYEKEGSDTVEGISRSTNNYVTVSISKATLTANNIVFDPENAEYNFTNSTIRPSYKVVIDGNEISNSDCEVTDSNGSSWGGTASTTEATNVGDYTIYFTGKGNNVNSNGSSPIAKTWHIVKDKNLKYATISLTKDSFEYTESEIDVTDNNGFKVSAYDEELSSDDFEIVSGNTGTDVDTYTLTITGKGEWTGTVTKTWTITKLQPSISAISNLSFNGLPQDLVNIDKESEGLTYSFYVSNKKLSESELSSVVFESGIPQEINAGDYYIYWIASGNTIYEKVEASTTRFVQTVISKPNVNIVKVNIVNEDDETSTKATVTPSFADDGTLTIKAVPNNNCFIKSITIAAEEPVTSGHANDGSLSTNNIGKIEDYSNDINVKVAVVEVTTKDTCSIVFYNGDKVTSDNLGNYNANVFNAIINTPSNLSNSDFVIKYNRGNSNYITLESNYYSRAFGYNSQGNINTSETIQITSNNNKYKKVSLTKTLNLIDDRKTTEFRYISLDDGNGFDLPYSKEHSTLKDIILSKLSLVEKNDESSVATETDGEEVVYESSEITIDKEYNDLVLGENTIKITYSGNNTNKYKGTSINVKVNYVVNVSVVDNEHANITYTKPNENGVITITVKPNSGYYVENVLVADVTDDKNITAVNLNIIGDSAEYIQYSKGTATSYLTLDENKKYEISAEIICEFVAEEYPSMIFDVKNDTIEDNDIRVINALINEYNIKNLDGGNNYNGISITYKSGVGWRELNNPPTGLELLVGHAFGNSGLLSGKGYEETIQISFDSKDDKYTSFNTNFIGEKTILLLQEHVSTNSVGDGEGTVLLKYNKNNSTYTVTATPDIDSKLDSFVLKMNGEIISTGTITDNASTLSVSAGDDGLIDTENEFVFEAKFVLKTINDVEKKYTVPVKINRTGSDWEAILVNGGILENIGIDIELFDFEVYDPITKETDSRELITLGIGGKKPLTSSMTLEEGKRYRYRVKNEGSLLNRKWSDWRDFSIEYYTELEKTVVNADDSFLKVYQQHTDKANSPVVEIPNEKDLNKIYTKYSNTIVKVTPIEYATYTVKVNGVLTTDESIKDNVSISDNTYTIDSAIYKNSSTLNITVEYSLIEDKVKLIPNENISAFNFFIDADKYLNLSITAKNGYKINGIKWNKQDDTLLTYKEDDIYKAFDACQITEPGNKFTPVVIEKSEEDVTYVDVLYGTSTIKGSELKKALGHQNVDVKYYKEGTEDVVTEIINNNNYSFTEGTKYFFDYKVTKNYVSRYTGDFEPFVSRYYSNLELNIVGDEETDDYTNNVKVYQDIDESPDKEELNLAQGKLYVRYITKVQIDNFDLLSFTLTINGEDVTEKCVLENGKYIYVMNAFEIESNKTEIVVDYSSRVNRSVIGEGVINIEINKNTGSITFVAAPKTESDGARFYKVKSFELIKDEDTERSIDLLNSSSSINNGAYRSVDCKNVITDLDEHSYTVQAEFVPLSLEDVPTENIYRRSIYEPDKSLSSLLGSQSIKYSELKNIIDKNHNEGYTFRIKSLNNNDIVITDIFDNNRAVIKDSTVYQYRYGWVEDFQQKYSPYSLFAIQYYSTLDSKVYLDNVESDIFASKVSFVQVSDKSAEEETETPTEYEITNNELLICHDTLVKVTKAPYTVVEVTVGNTKLEPESEDDTTITYRIDKTNYNSTGLFSGLSNATTSVKVNFAGNYDFLEYDEGISPSLTDDGNIIFTVTPESGKKLIRLCYKEIEKPAEESEEIKELLLSSPSSEIPEGTTPISYEFIKGNGVATSGEISEFDVTKYYHIYAEYVDELVAKDEVIIPYIHENDPVIDTVLNNEYVFNAIVDREKTDALITPNNVKIQYVCVSKERYETYKDNVNIEPTLWRDINSTSTLTDQLGGIIGAIIGYINPEFDSNSLKAHAFGEGGFKDENGNPVEMVRIVFTSNNNTKSLTSGKWLYNAPLIDNRIPVYVKFANNTITTTYSVNLHNDLIDKIYNQIYLEDKDGNRHTVEDLYIKDEEGNDVLVDSKTRFDYIDLPENASILYQTASVKFKGSKLLKLADDATNPTIRIRVNRASSNLDIKVNTRKYNGINIKDNKDITINLTPSYEDAKLNPAYAYIISGIEGDLEGYVSIHIDTNKMVYKLPNSTELINNIINQLLNSEIEIPENIKTLLEEYVAFDEESNIDEAINWINNILEGIFGKEDIIPPTSKTKQAIIDALVNQLLPEKFRNIYSNGTINYGNAIIDLIQIAIDTGNSIKLSNYLDELENVLEYFKIDQSAEFKNILEMVDKTLETLEGLNRTKVYINDEAKGYPKNAGIYTVVGSTIDRNYYPELTVDTFTIEAILDGHITFNNNLNNINIADVLSLKSQEEIDALYSATYHTKDDSPVIEDLTAENGVIKYIYFGGESVNLEELKNIKSLKDILTYTNNQFYLNDKAPTAAGSYVQVAYCTGNYIAENTRVFTIRRINTTLDIHNYDCTYGDNNYLNRESVLSSYGNVKVNENDATIAKLKALGFVDDNNNVLDTDGNIVKTNIEYIGFKINKDVVFDTFNVDRDEVIYTGKDIPTEAGGYDMTALYLGNNIYQPSVKVTKFLTIKPAKVDIEWKDSLSTVGLTSNIVTWEYEGQINEEQFIETKLDVTTNNMDLFATDNITIDVLNFNPNVDTHVTSFLLKGAKSNNYYIGITDLALTYIITPVKVQVKWNPEAGNIGPLGEILTHDYEGQITYDEFFNGRKNAEDSTKYDIVPRVIITPANKDLFEKENLTIKATGVNPNACTALTPHIITFTVVGDTARNYDIYTTTISTNVLTEIINKLKVDIAWNKNYDKGTIGPLSNLLTYEYEGQETKEHFISEKLNITYSDLFTEEGYSVVVSGFDPNVGSHIYSFSFDKASAYTNYYIDLHDLVLETLVTPKQLTVVWDNTKLSESHGDKVKDDVLTYQYDANSEYVKDKAKINGIIGEDEVSYYAVSGLSKEAGRHTLKVHLTGDLAKNYYFTKQIEILFDDYGSLDYVITKKPLYVNWIEPNDGDDYSIVGGVLTYTYNGKINYLSDFDQNKKFETTDVIDVDKCEVNMLSGNTTNVGIHNLKFVLTGKDSNNYELITTSLPYEIIKKQIKLYWNREVVNEEAISEEEVLNYIYNGEPQYPTYDMLATDPNEIIYGDNVYGYITDGSIIETDSINVGEYPLSLILAGKDAGNYELIGTLPSYKINQKEISVTWTKVVFEANENTKEVGYSIDLAEADEDTTALTIKYYRYVQGVDIDKLEEVETLDTVGTYLAVVEAINNDNYKLIGVLSTLIHVIDDETLIEDHTLNINVGSITENALRNKGVTGRITATPSYEQAITLLQLLGEDNELLSQFTNEELDRILTLTLESYDVDVDAEYFEETRQLIVDKIGEKVFKHCVFMDLELDATVSGVMDVKQVHEPGYGVPVTVRIDAESDTAENIIGNNKIYRVVKVHNGEVDGNVPYKLDIDENGNYFFNFKVDGFSYYGIYSYNRPIWVPKTGIE